MQLKLAALIQEVAPNEFIAKIVNNEKFKGTIVQSSTYVGAKRELLTSIKVKMAFDYKIEINAIQHEEVRDFQENELTKTYSEEFVELAL